MLDLLVVLMKLDSQIGFDTGISHVYKLYQLS